MMNSIEIMTAKEARELSNQGLFFLNLTSI